MMLLRFFDIFLVGLLFVADLYIYSVFLRKRRCRRWLTWAIFGLWAILAAGLAAFSLVERIESYRGLFMLFVLAVAVPQLVFAAVSSIDFLVRLVFGRRTRVFSIAGIVLAAAICFVTLYGGLAGTTRFTVREVEFRSRELPEAFDGYRMVQLSDIHLARWRNRKREIMERVVEIANRQNADAIMFTGDLVHLRTAELTGVEDVLGRLKAPDGVWSVLGNHDYAPYFDFENKMALRENLEELKRRQKAMGWRLLNNEHRFIERDGKRIAVAGVENAGSGYFYDYSDLGRALQGVGDSTFTVLLSHDPTLWRREVLDTGADLTLAGHTHGGQFKVGRLSFAALMYREWAGMYRQGEKGMYVNVGIGQTGFAYRFGAWPEITVVTLRKE